MLMEGHKDLVTVNATKAWKESGEEYRCRYDLIGFSANGTPIYICFFLQGDKEHLLVPRSGGFSGVLEERKLSLVPGLVSFHKRFGDGTLLILQEDNRLFTGLRKDSGDICIVTEGRDRTPEMARPKQS